MRHALCGLMDTVSISNSSPRYKGNQIIRQRIGPFPGMNLSYMLRRISLPADDPPKPPRAKAYARLPARSPALREGGRFAGQDGVGGYGSWRPRLRAEATSARKHGFTREAPFLGLLFRFSSIPSDHKERCFSKRGPERFPD